MRQTVHHVTDPPSKPLMIYDGDCRFCTLWIRRWRQITGDAVDYLPSQDPQITDRFPEIPREQFDNSVQLIEPDGAVHHGAKAVFRSMANNPRWRWPLRLYEKSPGFSRLTETTYRFVAGHRVAFSIITRLLWGKHVERPDYSLTRWIFLRALGLIYLVAFFSLWSQVAGLIGHNGVLPAASFMPAVKQQCDAQGVGLERYHLLPTFCWFSASDGFLRFQCLAGIALAVLLVIGIAPAPCLVLLWSIYLSLATVCRDFLGFQWDNLLLETGFLAIFFAPIQLGPGLHRSHPPSRLVLWLLRLLLFKLMFSSGCVKLLSGDPSWHNLTALTFHYETQPLPSWIAWYADKLPLWFQKLSCGTMFAIELAAPFLIFAPRVPRFFGGTAIAFFLFLVILTGNYTFFNWLTLVLCLSLLDDFALRRILPANLPWTIQDPPPAIRHLTWRHIVIIPLATLFIAVSLFQIASMFRVKTVLFRPIAAVHQWLIPFRTINSYGLFAVMTTERREIIIEGSNDGTNWLAYEFRYKPGDVGRRPQFVAPFQPRLDWQMWFAALGDASENPWFESLCQKLLQGSPSVLRLLKTDPFPDKPPRYLRAELYDYHFTTAAERRANGAWWKRERVGEYLPPVSLPE